MRKEKELVRLGNNIRLARKTKGLSQERLALNADIDRSYVGGIERGERNVSFLTLIKIAKCLDCDLSELVEGIPSNKKHKQHDFHSRTLEYYG